MGKSCWQYLSEGSLCRTLIIIFVLFYSETVFGADFTIICPPSFTSGKVSSVLCQVDTNTINDSPTGKCIQVNLIQFRLVQNGVSSNQDGSSYPACNTASTGNARCVNNTGGIATYELQFTANNATHYGSALTCRSDCLQKVANTVTSDYTSCTPISIIAPPATPTPVTTTTAATKKGTPTPPHPGCDLLCLLLLLIILFLPLPIPLPWPGYPIYVVLCRIPNCGRGTGPPQPDNWHPHYICGRRTNNVYFSACCVTNDGRAVLIWSRSPNTGRFVCYGTEKTPGTNSSGARHEMNAPPSHRNNVSAESGAVNNGNKHSSQKEKNKHIGTDGSPRKSRHPETPVELTPVRTSSPPQAATVPGDNQASGTPHVDHQASSTPRLRPLPESSRMTSVERNSTAETSNMRGRDKHPKLPPIGKPDNHT